MIDNMLQNQSSKFFEKSTFGQFCSKIEFNHSFQGSLKIDWGLTVKWTNVSFDGAKRSVMNGAMTFFNIFEERWAVENQVTSVLWIHKGLGFLIVNSILLTFVAFM